MKTNNEPPIRISSHKNLKIKVSRNVGLLLPSNSTNPNNSNNLNTPSRTPALKLRSNPQKNRTKTIQQASNAEFKLFLELLFEQKRLLHHRKYSKVYENLLSWIQKTDRVFFLGLEIKLLRYFFFANLKLLRNMIVKKVTNFQKTLILISQTLCIFANYYKFLTTALNKTFLDFECNNVLKQELNNYPKLDSSASENENSNDDLPPFLDLMAGKFGSFDLFQNKVNAKPESAFFIIKMLEFLVLIGTFYKRTKELHLAYKYLKKAHKLAYQFETNVNSDLLWVCSKAHLAFGVFLLNFNKLKKARKILYNTIVLIEAELCYRMSLNKPNELKKHEKLKIKRAMKTLICVVLNLIYCFENEQDIIRINESLGLVEYLCLTFLNQTNDEFRKVLVKLIKDHKRKYSPFFIEIAEINEIIENSLKNDHNFHEKLNPMYFPEEKKENEVFVAKASKLMNRIKSPLFRKKESPHDNNNDINEKLNIMNNDQIQQRTRFSLDLRNTTAKDNNNNLVINLTETSRRTATSFKKPPISIENIHNNNNENNNNNNNNNENKNENHIVENNNEDNRNTTKRSSSLFLQKNSFLFSDDEDSSSFLETSDQQNLKNSLLFQQKIGLSSEKLDQKLIKSYREDYKPKVLTTDEYFLKKKTSRNPNSKKIQQDFSKPREGIFLDNLDKYPRKHKFRHKTTHQKDYLTICFEENINESLKPGNELYKSPKEMNMDFLGILKQEEFDQSEFKFGRKMLDAKKRANLTQNSSDKSLYLQTHVLMNRIKDHAEGSIAKNSLEDQIKHLLKNRFIHKNFIKKKRNSDQNNENKQFPRSSLIDILVKHKEFFGLENQAKRIMKNLQISKNSQEKELEHQRKRSLYMENPQEAYNYTKRSLMANAYNSPKSKIKAPTKEECQNLTEKTNNMIKEEVNKDLIDSERKIDELLAEIEPGKRKIKQKILENQQLRNKGLEEMKVRFQDLSLTTGNGKQ